MSILQDISKRLLAVANLPPEQRNDALYQVLIYIEEVQYDMVLEQKNLIMSVIEDLIAENDAEQIAKSKLVFVEDVEEQIAPTIKTRAKKVVAPVVESTSDDLPDFIEKTLPIIQLPEPIIKLAGLRRKQLGLSGTIDANGLLSGVFNWNDAIEGYDFWDKITNLGDLREFKEKYGNRGEKVDEVIEFEELNQFVQTLTPPVASADLPDNIKAVSKIKDLPEPVKKLALLRQKEQNKPYNENVTINNFIWRGTPEGTDFWGKVNTGSLTEFKRIFGDKGKAVDAIIDELIGFAELFQLAEQKNAPAIKVTTPTPVVVKQEVKYVEVIFYPPSGGVLNLKTYSIIELSALTSEILKTLKVKTLKINFNAIADEGSYTTQIPIKISDTYSEILDYLVAQYDTFVKPELDWTVFSEKIPDVDRVSLNSEILQDAFKPTVAPTVAPVVAPKVVTPKPVKVVIPKTIKAVTPKTVVQKTVKLKKTKVEDDLSFLDDLENIF